MSTLQDAPETEPISSAMQRRLWSRAGELYRRHSRRVFYLCYRMVNDTDLAEDLTQEAFVHAFRRLSTFRQESRFTTWMHRIAVNTVLMFIRKRNSSIRECPLDPGFGRGEEAPFENAAVRQGRRSLDHDHRTGGLCCEPLKTCLRAIV